MFRRPALAMTLSAATLTAIVFAAPAASAQPGLFDLGLGASMGSTRTATRQGGVSTGFDTELNLRMRFLYFLGMDFGYSPTVEAPAAGQPTYSNSLRLSALVYVVPTPVVAAYAKGGVEASNFDTMFSFDDPTNAFHVGGGLDIHLTEGLALSLEYLVLVPGIAQQIAEVEAPPGAVTLAGNDSSGPIVDPANFRASLGLRYFF